MATAHRPRRFSRRAFAARRRIVIALGIGGLAPTAVGSRYDTMQKMATLLPKGRYLYCASGSHMPMYDDQNAYLDGLISIIRKVDRGGL
jgi:hypothetical protein